MKEYDKAVVSCRRIVCNPCALDEYEVTITPHGESELIEYTYGGPFESDEAIVSIRPRACFSPSYNKVKSQTKHVWLLTLL